jgi:hypothetical protein
MLYREDYYDPDSDRKGEMDVIVRKNRQGRLGQITGALDEHLRFSASDPQQPSLAPPAQARPPPLGGCSPHGRWRKAPRYWC